MKRKGTIRQKNRTNRAFSHWTFPAIIKIYKELIPLPENKIRKLTLAGMFAALAFACFSYLRIEIPMGLGLTGKIYVGHAFILLSALLLGSKYGALSGAIGLALADLLAGYTTSAPPTFLAKFLLGWSTAFAARHLCHLDGLTDDRAKLKAVAVAAIFGSVVNVISEPLIRFSFKFFLLGLPRQVAYISALNCAVSMAISNVVSIVLTVILYKVAEKSIRL
jgi:energy-coupling factor transport system substrate-specific component